jgi:hypothetical protein
MCFCPFDSPFLFDTFDMLCFFFVYEASVLVMKLLWQIMVLEGWVEGLQLENLGFNLSKEVTAFSGVFLLHILRSATRNIVLSEKSRIEEHCKLCWALS